MIDSYIPLPLFFYVQEKKTHPRRWDRAIGEVSTAIISAFLGPNDCIIMLLFVIPA